VLDDLSRPHRVVPIAAHDGITAHAQLACLSARNDLAALINHLRFKTWLNTPDRCYTSFQRVGRRALEGYRPRLRHAVSDGHLAHVHLGDLLPHGLDGAWRAGHDPRPQRG